MIENNKSKYVPELTSNLRNNYVSIPNVISKASGIRIFGKRLKSFIFTTDVAIIKNTNADAVIAVSIYTSANNYPGNTISIRYTCFMWCWWRINTWYKICKYSFTCRVSRGNRCNTKLTST